MRIGRRPQKLHARRRAPGSHRRRVLLARARQRAHDARARARAAARGRRGRPARRRGVHEMRDDDDVFRGPSSPTVAVAPRVRVARDRVRVRGGGRGDGRGGAREDGATQARPERSPAHGLHPPRELLRRDKKLGRPPGRGARVVLVLVLVTTRFATSSKHSPIASLRVTRLIDHLFTSSTRSTASSTCTPSRRGITTPRR